MAFSQLANEPDCLRRTLGDTSLDEASGANLLDSRLTSYAQQEDLSIEPRQIQSDSSESESSGLPGLRDIVVAATLFGAAVFAPLVGVVVLPSLVSNTNAVAVQAAVPIDQIFKKLEPVPVFAILTPSGQPVLAHAVSGYKGKIAPIFFNKLDAEQMLNRLKAENPVSAKGAKVVPVGLDKAYALQREHMNKSGTKEEIQFRFFAFDDAVKSAIEVLNASGQKVDTFHGVPVFQVKGLSLKQDGEDVALIPLFFTMDDAVSAWKELRRSTPNLRSQADVVVGSLESVLKMMEEDSGPQWTQILFWAPSESIKLAKKK